MKQEEFLQLLDSHQDMVYRIACHYTGNHADAQDVAQEAFLRLYQTDTTFSSEKHIQAWLIRVTINLSKNLLKSKWHQVMQQSPDTLEQQKNTEAPFIKEHPVTAAMQSLSEQDRLILHFYYYEEYSTAEIGNILSIREAAVRKRLSRARKRLEKRLKEVYPYET